MLALPALVLAALALPQREDPRLAARVDELLLDLEDASVGRLAHIELCALGALAAPTLTRHLLENSKPRHLALSCLTAHEYTARVALEPTIALLRALAAAEAESSNAGYAFQAQAPRWLVAELAPYVRDSAARCAPLLAADPDDRLRARTSLTVHSSIAQVHRALASDDLLVIELALELVACRGEEAAPVCGRTLQELWDNREDIEARMIGLRDRGLLDSAAVETKLARAITQVLPRDLRSVTAFTWILDSCLPHERVEALDCIAAFGAEAEAAVDTVAKCLFLQDDTVCRAALDTLARLGPTAEPAVDSVRQRIEHAADPETRRLAKIALRRITQPDDTAGRAADLIDDLVHPTRHTRARRELSTMGPAAAEVLLSTLADGDRRDFLPHAIDLLHALMPAASPAIAALFANPPDDFAHATWLRLRVAVDLAAGTELEAAAAAQLRRWAGANADRAPRCLALLDRLDSQRSCKASSSDADLAAALTTGPLPAAERAARLLRARGPLPPLLEQALTTALDRLDPEVASNEDALRSTSNLALAAAQTLVALAKAPPPAALARVMATGTPGQRVELLRRLPGSAWPADLQLNLIQPCLAESQVDAVRVAALDALTKLGPKARVLLPQLDRLATQRFSRVLARAAQRARRAAD